MTKEEWDNRCTTCDDTGMTIATERPCSCDAGDQHRMIPSAHAHSQSGWVLVPREPTDDMLDAASIGRRSEQRDAEIETFWEAMLSAVPEDAGADGLLKLVLRLLAEGVLSEGQVAQASGLDRVEIRRMMDCERGGRCHERE